MADSDLTRGETVVNKYGLMARFAHEVGLPERVWTVFDMGTPQNVGHGDHGSAGSGARRFSVHSDFPKRRGSSEVSSVPCVSHVCASGEGDSSDSQRW